MFAAHHEKSFVPAIFKFSNNHLFDNLESGKRNYCFGKCLENVFDFGSGNLYKPCISEVKTESNVLVTDLF